MVLKDLTVFQKAYKLIQEISSFGLVLCHRNRIYVGLVMLFMFCEFLDFLFFLGGGQKHEGSNCVLGILGNNSRNC